MASILPKVRFLLPFLPTTERHPLCSRTHAKKYIHIHVNKNSCHVGMKKSYLQAFKEFVYCLWGLCSESCLNVKLTVAFSGIIQHTLSGARRAGLVLCNGLCGRGTHHSHCASRLQLQTRFFYSVVMSTRLSAFSLT